TRQFHQIGVEVFGAGSPYADVEVIMQLSKMLEYFGLKDFTIKLNSLGCKADKTKFTGELRKYLKDKQNMLCIDCKAKMKRNVLRVLDCKVDSCIQLVRNAPNVLDSLCASCTDHFDKVRKGLGDMKIGFKKVKNLVRGLDYYTGTVFEVTHPALGAQDAIGAGGRYDNLVKDFGGPDIGAIGYALGMERIILALREKEIPSESRVVIYVSTLGGKAKIEGLKIANEVRKELQSLVLLTDIKESSLKSQLRAADKSNAKFVLILGEDEISKGLIVLRNMTTKEQVEVKRENVTEELKRRIEC
ncbi:MAG: histidine--tRNA ligase, partial [Candidatus Omnitrophica bacterium]|nr:histidine--tRNA ligase [Candidatus Omnitrophota bacterium]